MPTRNECTYRLGWMNALKKIDALKLREKLKLTQTNFWNPIGISQSGGSRYEHDRAIPVHIAILLAIRYMRDGDVIVRRLRA